MSAINRLSPDTFPPQLREIPEPPKELYLEGAWPSPESVLVTIVGSRKYSNYGREACEKIISELSGYPIAIVSGLAIGIDTIAHKAALAAKLYTLAVPGSGLERRVLHPASNRQLADQILESGGALLSEFPPEYPAGLHTFPRRNRIMAGLANAVLIIEAGEKSGTLITARLATDYNRDVYAVPGSIFSAGSVGTNNLIRQGATPIMSGGDLLTALGFELPNESAQQKLNLDELSEPEKKIYEILSVESMHRDELIRILELPTSEANSLLGIMEIKGIIKETMGEIRLN
ncbi:DNA-protecting protein DprA [Candidatus Nomurabacteria bacterium]|nr:DNA-protecting protein DprA [Candidatus Nomurabacteria bacterium]